MQFSNKSKEHMDQITELIALADKRIFGSKREEDISAN